MSLKKVFCFLLAGALSTMLALRGETAPDTREEISAPPFRAESGTSSEFMVSVWRTGEGLPVNDIYDLKETPDGYLWLGTYRGLVRFDGQRFQSFYTTPTGLRYGTLVGPLETDTRGRLWIAPDQIGLLCQENGVFTEVLTNSAIMKARTRNLCNAGTNGIFWVDANGTLGRFPADRPDEAEIIPGTGSNFSRWMRGSQGQMWLSNPRSLSRYQDGELIEVTSTDTAMLATPSRTGGVWVARDAKLWHVTGDGTVRVIANFPWKAQTRVLSLLEDKEGRVWFGTAAQGLFCYRNGEFTQVASVASGISCLLEDGQDNIWAGTRGGGLIRVRKRHFFRHGIDSGLRNEFVRSVSQDSQGRLWMVTGDGGLGWWENNVWHGLGPEQGWPGYDSLSVLPSRDGGVWISTLHRGLMRWRNGQFTKRRLPRNLPEAPVDLLEDRTGRLWMVTDNSGIFCLSENKLTEYSVGQGLPSRLIRRIVEDEDGNIWAGDWEGGIALFKGKKWEIVRKPSGHPDAVRSMVASRGTLWIGTAAGGLLRFKDGETARVSVEEGLPDICIQQLLLDNRGFLWGGTAHHLFRVSMEQLNAVMDGKAQQIQAITYGRSDGLPDLSFANWSDPRSWRTDDGELWFATANGVIHFHPSDLHEGKPPRAIVEQTFLDGKPVSPEILQKLRLGQNRLEFRFTAPCLSAPERVRFRYQLTGVDSTWVEAGTARTATYASIPAGKHVFKVVASSPDGVWSSHPALMNLTVHSAFWQTPWFLAFLAATFTGGGVWSFKRATVRRLNRRLERLRQERALDQERARIAQDIHDELGANLTSIGLLADLGSRRKSDPASVAHELDQISQTARESVAAMDAIVWALNPRNDSLDNFANYIAHFTRDFFRPTTLRTRLEIPAELPTMPLASDTRHQLFLLVKESFNNIVRHADATEVHLELTCDDNCLRLVIEDDGKGISEVTMREGRNGLENLRDRIERLGGSLSLKSRDGHGTKLEFLLPLRQQN